jgi:hypothetical protein
MAQNHKEIGHDSAIADEKGCTRGRPSVRLNSKTPNGVGKRLRFLALSGLDASIDVVLINQFNVGAWF